MCTTVYITSHSVMVVIIPIRKYLLLVTLIGTLDIHLRTCILYTCLWSTNKLILWKHVNILAKV